jgi:sRNA-binding carbon storage regulator CsrA
MLVLIRRIGEEIIIDGKIVDVKGTAVRVGIQCERRFMKERLKIA